MFGGAAGLVAFNGGTATNAADGTIRVGTSFAANAADLASIVDVVSVNYAAGMTSLSGGGTLVNNGLIRIGSLAQNATGMQVGGDGNTALNTIDPSVTTGPSARDVGIAVRGSSVASAVEATNAASGVITVGGVDSVGLLVENNVTNGSAFALNAGTIARNEEGKDLAAAVGQHLVRHAHPSRIRLTLSGLSPSWIMSARAAAAYPLPSDQIEHFAIVSR